MQIKESLIIANESFYLRNLTKADVPRWYECLQILPAIEYSSWNLANTDELMAEIKQIESSVIDSPIRLGIFKRDGNLLIGTIGLHDISTKNKVAEISYEISPQYWGRGIIPQAAEALCQWSFTVFNLNRIQAAVLESNDASQRALEKLGFEREGLLRAYRIVRSRPGNFWIFSRINPSVIAATMAD